MQLFEILKTIDKNNDLDKFRIFRVNPDWKDKYLYFKNNILKILDENSYDNDLLLSIDDLKANDWDCLWLEDDHKLINFEHALELLKQGRILTREEWNSKTFIFIPQNDSINNKKIIMVNRLTGVAGNWSPVVNDCLAEDWLLLNSYSTFANKTDNIEPKDEYDIRYFINDLVNGKLISKKGCNNTFLSYNDGYIYHNIIFKNKITSTRICPINNLKIDKINSTFPINYMYNKLYIIDYDKKENMNTLEAILCIHNYDNIGVCRNYFKKDMYYNTHSTIGTLLCEDGYINDWQVVDIHL